MCHDSQHFPQFGETHCINYQWKSVSTKKEQIQQALVWQYIDCNPFGAADLYIVLKST